MSFAHTARSHRYAPDTRRAVQRDLLHWYNRNQREMPWRRPSAKYVELKGETGKKLLRDWEKSTPDHAYAVLVSEIMLQQTRVSTVVEYFKRWMAEFPTIRSLAEAPLERVNELWKGLGYYRRARMLKKCAEVVMEKHEGKIPSGVSNLLTLPGVGRYTSGAVDSIVFSNPSPLVDGNVVRVLTRHRAIAAESSSPKTVKFLWDIAGELVPEESPGDFNQALMELGATICTPKSPSCSVCPIRETCLGVTKIGDIDFEDIASCDICTQPGPTKEVTRFPIKKKKTPPRPMYTLVSIVEVLDAHTLTTPEENTPYYLCTQRPSTGLLASLWQYPCVDFDNVEKMENEKESRKKRDSLGFSPSEAVVRMPLGTVTHKFTHITQTLDVEHIRFASRVAADSLPSQWCSTGDLKEVAISKGMQQCFSLFEKHKLADGGPHQPRRRRSDGENNQDIAQMFKRAKVNKGIVTCVYLSEETVLCSPMHFLSFLGSLAAKQPTGGTALIMGPLLWDIAIFSISVTLSLLVQKLSEISVSSGVVSSSTSRKMTHILIGMAFTMTWVAYESHGRILSAIIVFALTAKIGLVGFGILDDPLMVTSLSRNGKRQELLVGPLAYGGGITLMTLLYWRESPIGILTIVILCSGDGFAGLFGELYGKHALKWNKNKSWEGCLAFTVASISFSLFFLYHFQSFGFENVEIATSSVVIICFVMALIESLPWPGSWDNLVISLGAWTLLSYAA